MIDDPQGNTQEVEGTTTPIPSETKPAEPVEPKLPDEVAQRTAQEFDKLKQHNADLKKKLTEYENKNSVLDDLRPSAPPVIQKEPDKKSLVDENGYVDVVRLESSLTDARVRAKRAEEKAAQAESRVQRYEESEQVKRAHAEYPQLDPHNTEKFDPQFYELVKNELIGQMMKGEQDISKAAKKISELYTPKVDVGKVKDEAVKEYKDKAIKRDQATDVSSGKRGVEPTEREELIRRTQKGDNNALYKRLQASGY